MNAAKIQALTQTLSQSATVTIGPVSPTSGTMQFIVPVGYDKLVGITYDPSKDISVNLTSQMAGNLNVLQGFSTLTGTSYGFKLLYIQNIAQDIITLQWQWNVNPTAACVVTFSLDFDLKGFNRFGGVGY